MNLAEYLLGIVRAVESAVEKTLNLDRTCFICPDSVYFSDEEPGDGAQRVAGEACEETDA